MCDSFITLFSLLSLLHAFVTDASELGKQIERFGGLARDVKTFKPMVIAQGCGVLFG